MRLFSHSRVLYAIFPLPAPMTLSISNHRLSNGNRYPYCAARGLYLLRNRQEIAESFLLDNPLPLAASAQDMVVLHNVRQARIQR
jgi:hypothetical protein